MNPSQRVAIVGAGNVGASIAYSMLNQEVATEILILDIAEDMARAQVLDMQDAAHFTHGVKVTYANYSDLNDGDIIVITAGAAQKEGQSRLELLDINAKIIRSILAQIKETGKKVYIIMVTNPVDVLTYIAVKESGMPENMVFGSGTYLDSARLKVAISKSININPLNIHAYIMGEHGDSSFPALSNANVANIPLSKFVDLNQEYYQTIAGKVRNTAYEIIKGKKATYYGIGSTVAEICNVIVHGTDRILPLSVMLKGQYGFEDVTISIPVKLNSSGYELVGEVSLNEWEKEMFSNSVKVIKENIQKISK